MYSYIILFPEDVNRHILERDCEGEIVLATSVLCNIRLTYAQLVEPMPSFIAADNIAYFKTNTPRPPRLPNLARLQNLSNNLMLEMHFGVLLNFLQDHAQTPLGPHY